MDIDDFIDLVRRMRTAQKAYFAERTHSNLIEAKRLEKLVDQALDTVANEADLQINMFEEEG